MKTARPYRMAARAEAATQTGERILDAAVAMFWERPYDQLTLQDVADRASVSVQTVIRRFGGKDALLGAAAAREASRVAQQRGQAPVGDTAAAVRVLVDHYEELGDKVLTLLAEERRVPDLVPVAEQGRVLHREWCRRVFAPAIQARPPGTARARLVAQLVAVCDVHTWALLRRQAGLSRRQTETALVEMLDPLLTEAS
jgi:AcrR family transcriptional regulator